MQIITHKIRFILATVAAGACMCMLAVAAQAAPIGAYTTKGAWSFVSAPKLHPPKLKTDVSVAGSKLAPGYFMTANFKNLVAKQPMVGESGPLILNSKLQPVWFDPIGVNALAGDLKAQTYDGKPVLSWWQGVISPTGVTKSGEDVVVNQHYRQIATLTGKDGWVISEHDMVISGSNAWVTAYKDIPMNLTPYGGPANGVVLDCAVQEYDLKTGEILYSWDALNPVGATPTSAGNPPGTPNIPLSESKQRPLSNVPWDAYHLNSIDLTGNGTFLASMRNTWSAYDIKASTGQVEWTVSGNPRLSTFKLPANGEFQWQHAVELSSRGVLTVFDDACCEILSELANGTSKYATPNGPARGLVLKLNMTTHKASFVSQYSHGKNFYVAFLGDTQLLPDGNAVVGWGSVPYFSEYSKSGKMLLDAVWPTPDLSYRAYVQSWVGTPYFPPSGAVRRSGGKTTVYASWDGATQVVAWRVLAGSSAKRLATVVGKTAKTNFETAIPLSHSYKEYKVQALNSSNKVIGTSVVFPKPKSTGSLPGYY